MMALILSLPQMMKGGNGLAAGVELCDLTVAIAYQSHDNGVLSGSLCPARLIALQGYACLEGQSRLRGEFEAAIEVRCGDFYHGAISRCDDNCFS